MKIFGYNIQKNNLVKLAEKKQTQATVKKRLKLSQKILKKRTLDISVEMEEFIEAIAVAKDVEHPSRRLLYAIYEKIIERDAHLRSQMRTAHFAIQQSDFQILKDGKENSELKKIFETSWFTDFITNVIDQEFWGHSLIEFGYIIDGAFKDLTLIDRFHVIPEFQTVLLDSSADIAEGIPYAENLNNWFLVEIGGKKDLGLLLTAAIEIIYKKNSRNDWSSFNERFGMPLLSISTDTSNEKELDELEQMAANFGSNGYVIGSKATDFDVKQATGTESGHKKYEDKAKMCDAYLSKLINGQTSTSDEKSFVGSAEVQERILNTYTKGRLMRIQREVNDKLIPFLTYHGYPLESVKLQYVDLLKKEAIPAITETGSEKKKSKLKDKINNFNDVYTDIECFYENLNINPETLAYDKFYGIAQKFFDTAILRLHKLAKKDKLPDDYELILHGKELIKQTAKKLNSAIGVGISSIKYKPSATYLEKLTKDVWVFSAFKTHNLLKKVTSLIKDAEGDLKPWNIFRDDVLFIHKTFDINYLRTEYNTAVNSSLMAAKWKEFEANGDNYFLQYRTAGDEKVRSSHAEMNRITLPMSDSFWNSFFPPNGWGCRCNVVQVLKSKYEKTDSKKAFARGESSMIVIDKNGIINKKATAANKIFQFNPGKQAAVFPKNHPYYKIQQSNAEHFAKLMLAREVAKDLLPELKILLKTKTIKHKEIDTAISFTTKGLKEAFNQPHKFPVEKAYAVKKIDELIKNAEYVGFRLNDKNNKNIKGFHYLKTYINNEVSYIVLRENNDGKISFYSITDGMKKK